MKLLHTSDWHLGARLGRHDRAPDHLAAIKGLLEVAKSARPDLILHTGDLFDASRPPYEALQMGVRALGRLSAIAPTLVLSGNHDSSILLDVLDELAGAATPRRLWLATHPRVATFPDVAPAPVAVACVPFLSPSAVVDLAAADQERFEGTYADGVKVLNRGLLNEAEEKAGARGIVLYAAHLHVQGARPGKSERRITVGEDYATHVEGLQRALYCAFGHIHDPQLLPGGTARGRYAGSLIPLDFGESRQTKQAVLVTIGDGGVQEEPVDLPGGRPLTEFTGTLDELVARAANGGLDGCLLKARVVSDDPIPDLADRLAERAPGCAVFELINAVSNQPVKPIEDSGSEDDEEPALDDLFLEWRQHAAKGVKAPHDAVRALFAQAVGGVGQNAVPGFGLTALRSEAERTLAALAAQPHGGGS